MKHYQTPTADLFYRQQDVLLVSSQGQTGDGNLGDIDMGGGSL